MTISIARCGPLKSKGEFNVHLGVGYSTSLAAVERDDIIIAIDVLRCSSSIVTALANGAKAVIPAHSLREARSLSKVHGAMLVGERRGIRPKGFELGNSPLEFRQERVKNKTIVMTTTSGTKAIVLGREARRLFVGSFLNLNATAKFGVRLAKSSGSGISLVTAGTRGKFSLEDFLCAGALSDLFSREGGILDDGCTASAYAYRWARSDLRSAIRAGVHAKYLRSIDLGDDVTFCTRIDLFEIAAVLKANLIVAVKP